MGCGAGAAIIFWTLDKEEIYGEQAGMIKIDGALILIDSAPVNFRWLRLANFRDEASL